MSDARTLAHAALAHFEPGFAAIANWHAEARVFAFAGENLLLDGAARLPAPKVLPAAPRSHLFIGSLHGQPCQAAQWPADTPTPPGLEAHSLRTLHEKLSATDFALASRAKQLLPWDLNSRFCGACGQATAFVTGEPAKQCTACSHRDYPRLSPAIMVLIRKGGSLLLARSPHFRPGMYSALAGFVEAGESVEACVHREVFEEVGLRIKNLRWFGSQSWPFPHSLMLAFHAEYDSGDIRCQPGEIEDAQWFTPPDLPSLPSNISISGWLIRAALEEIQES